MIYIKTYESLFENEPYLEKLVELEQKYNLLPNLEGAAYWYLIFEEEFYRLYKHYRKYDHNFQYELTHLIKEEEIETWEDEAHPNYNDEIFEESEDWTIVPIPEKCKLELGSLYPDIVNSYLSIKPYHLTYLDL